MSEKSWVLILIFCVAIPGFAGEKALHMEESTRMDIPIVGRISTHKDIWYGDCRVREDRMIKIHNLLTRLVDADGKINKLVLSDLCEEQEYELDKDAASYTVRSFAEIRADQEEENSQVEVEVEHEAEPPRIERSVERIPEKINGFKTRLITTTIYRDEDENPLVIREWLTRKNRNLEKAEQIQERLNLARGMEESYRNGVPGFVQLFLDAMNEEQELSRPDGYVVKAEIHLLDSDGDDVFSLSYDLLLAEKQDVDPGFFEIPAEFQRAE